MAMNNKNIFILSLLLASCGGGSDSFTTSSSSVNPVISSSSSSVVSSSSSSSSSTSSSSSSSASSATSSSSSSSSSISFQELNISGAVIPKIVYRFPWSQYEANLQGWGTIHQWDIMLGNYSPFKQMPSGSYINFIPNDRKNAPDAFPYSTYIDIDLNGSNGLIAQGISKGFVVVPHIPMNNSSLTIAQAKNYIDICFSTYPNLNGIYFGASTTDGNSRIAGNDSLNYFQYYSQLATYARSKVNRPIKIALHVGGSIDGRQTAQMWRDLLDGGYVDVMMVDEQFAPKTDDASIAATMDPRYMEIKDSYKGKFGVYYAANGTVTFANLANVQWLLEKKYNITYLMLSEVDVSANGTVIDSLQYWNQEVNDLFPAPKYLQASSANNGIVLSFGYLGGAVGADFYNIYKDSGSGYVPIISVADLPYTDTNVVKGRQYKYKVIAKNTNENRYTDYSSEVIITY